MKKVVNKRPKAKTNKKPSERNLGFFQKNNKDIATIYIGNMSYQKKERDIKQLFSKYGEVSYVRLMLDPETSKSRGFAFVQMKDKKLAKLAIEKLNGQQLDGRTLKVSIAKENNSASARVARKPKEEAIVSEPEAPARPSKRKRDKGLKLLFNHLNR